MMRYMTNIKNLKKEVKNNADHSRARLLQKYFKTGPGEYGEGDIFAGLAVSQIKKIARNN